MGNLYVIRHGQTTCNADGVIQGPRVDADLSETGLGQAEALADAFGETPINALYASPMRRARQTANALIRRRLGAMPASVAPEMYEMDYGHFCGQPLDAVRDEVTQILDAWNMGFVDHAFPGGESPIIAQHRIRSFARRLRDEARDHDVAVVAHGRINRVLLATLTGTPLKELDRFPQDNANVNHLEIGDDVQIRRINDTSHLDTFAPSFS